MDRVTDHLIQGYSIFCHMEEIYEEIDEHSSAVVIIDGLGEAKSSTELEEKLEAVFKDMSCSLAMLLQMTHVLKTTVPHEDAEQISDILICAEKIRQVFVDEFDIKE